MDEGNAEQGCRHDEIGFSKSDNGDFSCHTDHLEKYECDKCKMSSHFLADFSRIDSRQNSKLHICHKCNSFNTHSILVLEEHQIACKPKVSEEYTCEHCSHRTGSLHALKIHNLNYHTAPEDITSFECPHCRSKSRQFAPRDSILEHIESSKCDFCERPPEVETWLCTQCPYRAPSREDLAEHCSDLHRKIPAYSARNDVSLYSCDYCPYTAKRKLNLKRHVRNKHIEHDDSEYFKCDLCSFKSLYKNSLGSHCRWKHGMYAEEKTYGCDLCAFTTKKNWYIKEHKIRMHTPMENIQWMMCQYCPYTAKMGRALRRHMRVRHPEYGHKMWVKCAFCNHKARNAKELRGHVKEFHVNETNEDLWDHTYAMKIVM